MNWFQSTSGDSTRELPSYLAPPRSGPLRFASTLRTAAELAADVTPEDPSAGVTAPRSIPAARRTLVLTATATR